MTNRILTTAIFVLGLSFTLPAMAIGKIVSQADAVEANSVTAALDKKLVGGVVTVDGCEKCPVTIIIDSKTGFFKEGKAVPRDKIGSLSGKPGTVIFKESKDVKTAIRVRW
ncbi:MAG TPA: hypothetical protein VIM41_04435 [Gammaproteobacteria bacterium]